MMSSVNRAMCCTPAVEVEVDVLLDLALLRPSAGSLIGNLIAPVRARHHLAAQRGELGGDVLVVEGEELVEAEGPDVAVDPVVHLPVLDVADDVVDPRRARRPSRLRSRASKPGRKGPS